MRPPPDDGDDEPETVTFGIAALDARVEDAGITFPAEASDIVRQLGDPDIPYDASGHAVALSEVMEKTHVTRFESEQELLNELHPVFESYRERAASGILAQLRAMLPF